MQCYTNTLSMNIFGETSVYAISIMFWQIERKENVNREIIDSHHRETCAHPSRNVLANINWNLLVYMFISVILIIPSSERRQLFEMPLFSGQDQQAFYFLLLCLKIFIER